MTQKLPLPPFNFETATQKVQMAEDAWNTKDPEKVSLAYTMDTEWRNRDLFINGREEVKQFLICFHSLQKVLNIFHSRVIRRLKETLIGESGKMHRRTFI